MISVAVEWRPPSRATSRGWAEASGARNAVLAQQMVILLGSLAHNAVVWSRSWLAASPSKLQHHGTLRMVRDVFHGSRLSRHGCKRAAGCSDCAQPGCPLGISLGQLLAPSVGSCSRCHSVGPN